MHTKKNKIELITLGCSKNTVDSERLTRQFVKNNYSMVDSSDKADSIIINTCGFIDEAKEESINTILHAVQLKKEGKIGKVVVAGCLSERYKDSLREEIPEVDAYFGTEEYEGVLKEFGADFKKELLGERELSTPKHYAYLKISEGCDNPCSFCAIPLMRGGHVSKPMDKLIEEARFLSRNGVKELIIIGQDTTDYGKDIYGKRNLAELLNKLSQIDGIEWIRLLYAYPSHFQTDVIEAIADNPKICNYLDMPLQHVSDNVLKSMRRGISSRRTKELLNQIRERHPSITLRTTFITGYPNETEAEHRELYNFIKDIGFERMGIFKYSVEESTPSFILNDPVPDNIKEERKAELMELQKEISWRKNKELIGSIQKVIIDSKDDGFYIGRSQRDAPEVDCEVIIDGKKGKLEVGNFYNIEIFDCNEYDLFGKLSK